MESRHLGQDPTSDVVHCPFNTSHAMPRKTLVLHLTKCPDRVKNKQNLENYLKYINKFLDNLKVKEFTNNSNTCKKDDTPINQNQCMMKPQSGLSKTKRKQYRAQATQQFANIDLSYNPNLSIHDRQSSTTSNGGNTYYNLAIKSGSEYLMNLFNNFKISTYVKKKKNLHQGRIKILFVETELYNIKWWEYTIKNGSEYLMNLFNNFKIISKIKCGVALGFANQRDQQIKKDGLFFGKRSNN
ncbi:hypothetical protein AGLY_005605 [Aphis glycines]|uniref:CHHC U11-48K-type domain-containing protein n=1 Tax=Aphis glycines TaxID=307491 RepID=A0A6G0TTC5_APHGL|nr:hypothetical protein AGLY_005605 [Aphis glycines]